MSNTAAKTTIISTIAAALIATSFSIAPVQAGMGGGGGGEPGGSARLTVKKRDGSSTTIRSRNKSKKYTITKRNKKGKVVSKRVKRKKRGTFVTIHNPDGTSRTIRRVSRDRSSWAATTNANGHTHVSGRSAAGVRFNIVISPFGIGFGH